jgi:hypothetical protein
MKLDVLKPEQNARRGNESSLFHCIYPEVYLWICLSNICQIHPATRSIGILFRRDQQHIFTSTVIWHLLSAVFASSYVIY